ncbi:unnamed protein product (macronuclear) [Paramecium tetraurelia]|uniref:Uncharacterized protein n=1 Tax=Paramecium tetraurelia TaxID=5888 RepID=A0BPB0_PARTE|nr:uncharacterized protein GSPATT00005126001 [Paramecium tetraurelia]CAK60377.1 unnamed protein product [Paramecium tetraurelia]|eukprot:XP_001427775.1 hypothetical protein (macronuclear) [Paramecium tetraurelia strain d4-2]
MIHGPNSQFSGAFTIGKRYECAIYQTNPNPGPNHYSVNPIDKPTGYKFSKSNRKPLYQASVAPDPGTYDSKLQAIISITQLGNHTSHILSQIYQSKGDISQRNRDWPGIIQFI